MRYPMLSRIVDMKIYFWILSRNRLAFFHEATDILQGDKNPTAPKVIPLIQKI